MAAFAQLLLSYSSLNVPIVGTGYLLKEDGGILLKQDGGGLLIDFDGQFLLKEDGFALMTESGFIINYDPDDGLANSILDPSNFPISDPDGALITEP